MDKLREFYNTNPVVGLVVFAVAAIILLWVALKILSFVVSLAFGLLNILLVVAVIGGLAYGGYYLVNKQR